MDNAKVVAPNMSGLCKGSKAFFQESAPYSLSESPCTAVFGNERREGLRRVSLQQDGREVCTWWTDKTRAEVDEYLKKLNERLASGAASNCDRKEK